MEKANYRLLLIENGKQASSHYRDMLESHNTVDWAIEQVRTVEEGLRAAGRQEFDLLLLDPDGQSPASIQRVGDQLTGLPLVILTDLAGKDQAREALQRDAPDFLVKEQLTPAYLANALQYILDRQRLRTELNALKLTDTLSGLNNRKGFFDKAEDLISYSQRDGRSITLFYLDIENLKGINAWYGQKQGDQAVVAAARVLQEVFRPPDLMARMGGDEFAVLSAELSPRKIEELPQRIAESQKLVSEELDLPFTLSLNLGAAEWNPQYTHNLDLLIQRAGQALYARKLNKERPGSPEGEEGVLDSDQVLKTIFDHIKLGIFRVNQNGELTFANRYLVDLLGYDSLGETSGVRILKTHLQIKSGLISRILDGKEEIQGAEYTLTSRGKTEIPIRLSIHRAVENGGAILTGTVEDISSQLAVRQLSQLQASALNAAANAIVIMDCQGRMQWCNPAFTDLTGYQMGEVSGIAPGLSYDGEQDEDFYLQMWETIQSGRVWQGELISKKRNGKAYSERMTITPLLNEKGDLTHFIAVREDLTALLKNQDLLERRLAEVTTFSEVATAGIEITDEDQLISRVTDLVWDRMYPDHFGVLLLGSDGTELLVHPSHKGIGKDLPGKFIPSGEGIIGRCIRENKTILIQDVREDEDYICRTIPGTRSELVVPLLSDSRLIGVLNAESKKPNWFTADDARILETIAKQLGTAIAHLRANRLEHEQRKIAETLSDVALVLNSSLEIDEILDQVLNELSGLIRFKTASFFLCGKGTARVIRHRGFEEQGLGEWLEGMELELGNTGIPVLDRLVKTQQPHLIRDTANDPEWKTFPQTAYIRSYLGIPILKNQQLLGFINLDHDQPNAFKESQIEMLTALANQISTALENADLYRQQNAQLEFLESLRQIDYAITGSLDLQLTLQVILTEVMARLRVDAVDVLFSDSDARRLKVVALRGFMSDLPPQDEFHPAQGLPELIVRQRTSCAVQDLESTNLPIGRAELFAEESFHSYYGLPLISKGKIVGVLEFFHRGELDVTPEWQRFAETVATQSAIAIDNYLLFDNLQKANLELSRAYDETLEGWADALELRDRETEGHSRRVVDLTMQLTDRLNVPKDQWVHIRRGALLHDIGKMGIPDRILQKQGKLTEDEWRVMRQHPLLAEEWLKSISYLKPALEVPKYHHERWDGTGYPFGLKGEQIPLSARIFAVVDVWDALLVDRPYRKAWPIEKVIEHIQNQAGKHFDPRVVQAFLEITTEQFALKSSIR